MADMKSMNTNEQLPTPHEKQRREALAFCDELAHDFKERADRHKRMFKLLRYSSVALAITVTIVSTLTATQGKYLWIVPIVSGISALCTTLLSATNSQERWVHSRGVEQQLKAEKFLYLQQADSYATSDEETNARLFSARVVAIWSEAQHGWAQSITKVSYELPSHIGLTKGPSGG